MADTQRLLQALAGDHIRGGREVNGNPVLCACGDGPYDSDEAEEQHRAHVAAVQADELHDRTLPMNDLPQTVVIPVDRHQAPILDFVRASALDGCTFHWPDENGVFVVEARLPIRVLSSGEQAAWAVLVSLASGDLRRFLERVDANTVDELVRCLARTGVAA